MSSRRAPGKTLTLQAAAVTDAGPTRCQNEDSYLCDPEQGLFIVADGMGGKNAGALASRAVVTVLPALLGQALETLAAPSPRDIRHVLSESLARLSHDLHEKSQAVPALSGLGSTAVVLLIRQGVSYLAFAGDSRGYLFRRKRIVPLTVDQTTARALVRAGHLSPEAAAKNPLRHALEEYVGKPGKLSPGLRSRRVEPNDRWLLCSDGITKAISDEALEQLLGRHLDAKGTLHDLLEAATEADGSDNMTAVLVDVT